MVTASSRALDQRPGEKESDFLSAQHERVTLASSDWEGVSNPHRHLSF